MVDGVGALCLEGKLFHPKPGMQKEDRFLSLLRRVEGVPKERVQSTEEGGELAAKEYISPSSNSRYPSLFLEKSIENEFPRVEWYMPHVQPPTLFELQHLCIILECFLHKTQLS